MLLIVNCVIHCEFIVVLFFFFFQFKKFFLLLNLLTKHFSFVNVACLFFIFFSLLWDQQMSKFVVYFFCTIYVLFSCFCDLYVYVRGVLRLTAVAMPYFTLSIYLCT